MTARQPKIILRKATADDAPLLALWDREPHVIACTGDDPDAQFAFGSDWVEEIANSSDVFQYYIAEADGRPIGALLDIDPAREPSHYWGDIEDGLRALDIWIGPPDALNRGFGTRMMSQAIDACFARPEVEAIIIDPLNSNTDAHRFYRRLGFQEVGRRVFGEDECLVHRLTRADWKARL